METKYFSILLIFVLILSCSNRNFHLIDTGTKLNEYKVKKFKIDRGTIYINDKYIFYDHMIREGRLDIMEKLYLLKAPMKISQIDSQLIISKDQEVIFLELQYDL